MSFRSPALSLLLLAVPLSAPLASGYHPPLDQAFDEAEIVVAGKLTEFPPTEGDNPYAGIDPDNLPSGVYCMDVRRAFKGTISAGSRVVIWDPYEGSTASYALIAGHPNLTFLVPADLSDPYTRRVWMPDGDKDVDETDLVKLDGPVYTPIRNIPRWEWGVEEYDGWLKLLDLKLDPPADLLAEYRGLANQSRNRYVLEYILSHWPRPLAAADVALFRQVAQRHADDPYITSPALEALKQQGEGFDTAEVVRMLEKSPWYGRDTAIGLVNEANIAECQDILFRWLREDEHSLGDRPVSLASEQQAAAEALARLAPEFLEQKLRDTDLPFWQLLPALQALGINGSDVGKPDYPEDILALSPYVLGQVAELYRGEDFHAVCLMINVDETDALYVADRDEWRTALPLLLPALRSGESATRRAIRALMGSLGFDPRITPEAGEEATALMPMEPPVRLTLELLTADPKASGPVVVRLSEQATTGDVQFCFAGEPEWSIWGPAGGIESGSAFGAFEQPDPPRDQFVTPARGDTRTSQRDLAEYAHEPGKYRVSVVKVYPHDGTDHGLHAWTGAVASNVLEFTVTEDQALTGPPSASAATQRLLLAALPAMGLAAALVLVPCLILCRFHRYSRAGRGGSLARSGPS